ncbi:MAG: hypothetical protein QM692_08835 [Thermomicrobiales bacterium]
MVDRLGGERAAGPRLRDWGWQGMRYRTYACDKPPKSGFTRAEVNVHQFATAQDAREAADFFGDARASGTSLMVEKGGAVLGDYAVVVAGPVQDGKEFTLYIADGSRLIRVTGVSTSGIPFIDVRQIALDTLGNQPR